MDFSGGFSTNKQHAAILMDGIWRFRHSKVREKSDG
jgi:hypothetical protein